MEPVRTEAESKDMDVTMEEPEQGHSGETGVQADVAGEVPVIHLSQGTIADGRFSLLVTKENGDTEHPENTSSDKLDDTPAGTEDTEMQEVGKSADAGGSGSSPAAAANGTPASSKKASNGSSKKRSSIIPEHKSKKLNKKKSRPMTHLDAKPGEYYLGRMRGHPPWPSIICDEEMLPAVLLGNRPVTTKQADGTYKKPEYADGGKRAYERTFPIMFL